MPSLAIIGSGIAGLGCAHFLHDRFDLTIYEQNDYPGGHTNTVTVNEEGQEIPIDTGFMVFNHVTYPNLTRLFRELDVPTKPAEMSFSVQHCPTGLEYNGGSLDLLFAQRRNLLRPRFWAMLLAMDRFNKEAVSALQSGRYDQHTLRDYIAERGYGADMLNFYLVPMSSAVWSAPPEKMLDFPAMTLVRFWHNHGFLGLHQQHPWRTVIAGSRAYVRKITAPFHDRVLTQNGAARVTRLNGRAQVVSVDGVTREYDKVVLACHADQALRLLADPTEHEVRLLSPFKYQSNTATLHTDTAFMPKVPRCWASWNYRIDHSPDGRALPTTHYWMNSLQGVSKKKHYFVSINAHDRVAPEKILRKIEYEHPLFDLAAVAAQKELPSLNRISSSQTTYFAGAWFKYGFHEDGFTSALECARAIAQAPLWS